MRWPDGVRCLRCGSDKISRISTRRQFDCDSCRYRFSVTTGTVFHDSHLPLPKWFLAILLMCEAKKGISANQMKRTLGVAHKTAWYLCHRIREAMRRRTRAADRHRRSGRNLRRRQAVAQGTARTAARTGATRKTMVLGSHPAGGNIRLSTDAPDNRESLHGFIQRRTSNPKRIITDEWTRLQRHRRCRHDARNRGSRCKQEYVRGDVTRTPSKARSACSSAAWSVRSIRFPTST